MTTAEFEFEVSGGFQALRTLRHRLADWMGERGAPPAAIEDVQLAVNELAANAIEASPSGEADVEGAVEAERVKIIVTNVADRAFDWNDGQTIGPRTEDSARGRGLQIAATLVDSLEVATASGLTRAVLVKELAPADSA